MIFMQSTIIMIVFQFLIMFGYIFQNFKHLATYFIYITKSSQQFLLIRDLRKDIIIYESVLLAFPLALALPIPNLQK